MDLKNIDSYEEMCKQANKSLYNEIINLVSDMGLFGSVDLTNKNFVYSASEHYWESFISIDYDKLIVTTYCNFQKKNYTYKFDSLSIQNKFRLRNFIKDGTITGDFPSSY